MAKIKLQSTIRSPLEKVVGYFSNPELYFGVHSSNEVSYKILSSRENEILVEEERNAGSRRLKTTSRMVLHLPHRIESEVVAGGGGGSKSTTTFEAVKEGTRVTCTMDMKLGGMAGRVLGRIGKKWMKKAMEEELEKDRKYLEGG